MATTSLWQVAVMPLFWFWWALVLSGCVTTSPSSEVYRFPDEVRATQVITVKRSLETRVWLAQIRKSQGDFAMTLLMTPMEIPVARFQRKSGSNSVKWLVDPKEHPGMERMEDMFASVTYFYEQDLDLSRQPVSLTTPKGEVVYQVHSFSGDDLCRFPKQIMIAFRDLPEIEVTVESEDIRCGVQ